MSDKNKKENIGPLTSQDVPTKFEYLNKPIKPKRPKPKKVGIILEDKYARLIRKRKKKEIVSIEDFSKYVGKEIFICGEYIYGSIILNEPMKVDRVLLKNHSKRHLMSDYDIDKLWPDEKKFFSYSFRIVRMFKKPIKYKKFDLNFGIIDDVEFKIKKVKEKMRDILNLNREHDDKLRAAEGKQKIEQANKEKHKNYKSNSYLDKYYKTINRFKSIEFTGKYKDIANLFLSLFELYLEKSSGKIYDKDGLVFKPAPDITENYIRVRIRSPRNMVEDSFRTIVISKNQGIKAIVAKLKKDPKGSIHIQSVLFEREKWTVKRALKWVKDHKDSLKNMAYVKCGNCGKYFDYLVENEAGMGYVKCPHCGENVDQEGKTHSEKRADTYVDDGYIPKDKYKGKPEEK